MTNGGWDGRIEIDGDRRHRFGQRRDGVLLLQPPARHPLGIDAARKRRAEILELQRGNPDARVRHARGVAGGRRLQETVVHPHRHLAGRGRHLAHQPTGIVGGEGGKNLQLRVERIGLGARRVQRRTASIKLVRALVGPAHDRLHPRRIAHHQCGRIHHDLPAGIALDGQAGDDGGGETVLHALAVRGIAGKAAESQILLLHQYLGSNAAEVDQAAIHCAAIKRQLHRSAATGQADVIENIRIQRRHGQQHAAFCGIDAHRHIGGILRQSRNRQRHQRRAHQKPLHACPH